MRDLCAITPKRSLVLPAEVASLLEVLRSIGTSERGVDLERDGWIVMEALFPEVVSDWVRHKQAALVDAEFRELYLACDRAWDLDPADPRLEQLPGWMVAWAASHTTAGSVPEDPAITVIGQLMDAELSAASPAWRRLGELAAAVRRSVARGDPGSPDRSGAGPDTSPGPGPARRS